jgi:hypothetical protein
MRITRQKNTCEAVPMGTSNRLESFQNPVEINRMRRTFWGGLELKITLM